MDADFSHNPNDLPKLYAACTGQGADVAIGSRYCSRGECGELAVGPCVDVLFRLGGMSVSSRVWRYGIRRRALNVTAVRCWRRSIWTVSISKNTPFRWRWSLRLISAASSSWRCRSSLSTVPGVSQDELFDIRGRLYSASFNWKWWSFFQKYPRKHASHA